MDKQIFVIEKGQEEVRGNIQEYPSGSGKYYINIRTWYPGKDKDGSFCMLPSQKGISLPVSSFPDLLQGIKDMEGDVTSLLVSQLQAKSA